MTAFDTDPGIRRLFCFTHPDDELGIAVWVRRLTAAGAGVHLSWTHRTDAREREAREAAKVLGVKSHTEAVWVALREVVALKEFKALMRRNAGKHKFAGLDE